MDYEDEIPATTDAIKAANEYAENQRKEQESKRLDTIAQMEQNRMDEEKAKKKLELIAEIVKQMQQPIIADLREQRSQIEEIKTAIGQISEVFRTMNNPQAPILPTAANLNDMPPELKAQMASGLLDGIAKLVMAWRSNSVPAQATNANWFNDFSQQIIANMLQAGVDGMMRNVYDNYNPIPPKPITQQQIRQPPPQTHNLD